MSASPKTELHGVLVVDKERGPTSHDVVGHARRALGTREVGHTGTLDPMATGALVLLVGEATKMSAYLMASDKAYAATLTLGTLTDTIDALGNITETAEVPALSRDEVQRVAESFLGEQDQRAPLASAIKVDGQVLHRALRKGKEIEAPVRRVRLDAITIDAVRGHDIDFHITCGKGYYVRALARDLAKALGTVGHLSSLRRTRNGAFLAETAVSSSEVRAARGDAERSARLRDSLLPLSAAVRGFHAVVLSDAGVIEARHGKLIQDANVIASQPGRDDVIVARDEGGRLIALVHPVELGYRVVRGFQPHMTSET